MHKIKHVFLVTTFIITSTVFANSPDEAAIETLIESIGVFADRSAYQALERLFADEVLLDYSSLNNLPAERKKSKTIMTEWASVLPGFDRTRHAISNIKIELAGEKASATAKVVAGHWIGGDYWQVDGHYQYAFERQKEVWKVTALTFTLDQETGSRDVFGPAMEVADKRPTPYLQQQRTRQAVLDFLTGLEKKDMDKVNGVWSDDAVQEMPYVPSGFPKKVEGKDALIEFYADWPHNADNPNFTDHLLFYDLQDPNFVFVEYQGRVDIITTGREYRQSYGALFQVDSDGKITLFREYFDPRVFAQAFGIGESRSPAD